MSQLVEIKATPGDEFCDVTISFEDRERVVDFSYHRVVLATRSEYFKTLFTFGDNLARGKFTIEVDDAETAHLLLSSFYSEPEPLSARQKLEMIKLKSFFMVNISSKELIDLSVPPECFDALLEVARLPEIGPNLEVLNSIKRNLPKDYKWSAENVVLERKVSEYEDIYVVILRNFSTVELYNLAEEKIVKSIGQDKSDEISDINLLKNTGEILINYNNWGFQYGVWNMKNNKSNLILEVNPLSYFLFHLSKTSPAEKLRATDEKIILIEDLVMSVKNLSDWKTLYTFDFCSEKENLKLAQLIKDGAQAVFVTTRRITLYATVSQEILINYHGDLRGRDYFFSENNMTLVWSGHGPCGSDFLCSSQQHKKSTFCSCDLGKYFLFFLKLGKEGVNIEKKEVEIYTKTVAMLDGGEKIITASSKSILMWSVKNVEVIKEYPIESFASSCVVLTSDEKYMFFPSDSGFSFLRLDIESGEILTIYQETPEIKTYNLLLTPDEKYIISVGSGERVSVWDLESGRLVKRVHIPGLEEIYCLDRLDYEDS